LWMEQDDARRLHRYVAASPHRRRPAARGPTTAPPHRNPARPQQRRRR
jgi:hypothetical protein